MSKIKNFFSDFKMEFTCKNKDFTTISLSCLVIGFFIFLSIFFKWFNIVALLVACGIILYLKNGRCFYILLFLLPLMSIFKLNVGSFYLTTIVAGVVVATLGIKLLIDFIKKEKKVNWLFTVFFIVLFCYFLISSRFKNISILGSLELGLVLLFLFYYYKEDLDIKEVALLMLVGVLFSVFIGLFRPINERLQELIVQYTAGGLYRFSASCENVNVFIGELVVLFSVFAFLYINKSINYLFYLMFVFTSIMCLMSLSKSALLTYFAVVVITLVVMIVLAVKKKEKKRAIIFSVLIVVSYLALFFVFHKRIDVYLSRVTGSFDAKDKLSSLTTGRSEIWGQYLRAIFGSVKSILFGFGVGAENIGEYNGGQGFSCHNTYIQCLYYVGIVGVFLIIGFFLSSFDYKKINIKNTNWYGLLVLLALAMYLFGLEFFSYRLSNYLILFFLACRYKCQEKQLNIVENKNIEKEEVKNKIEKEIVK